MGVILLSQVFGHNFISQVIPLSQVFGCDFAKSLGARVHHAFPCVMILPLTLSFIPLFRPHFHPLSLLSFVPLPSPVMAVALSYFLPICHFVFCHFVRRFRQLCLPNPFPHRSRTYVIIPSSLPYCTPFAIISRTFHLSLAY